MKSSAQKLFGRMSFVYTNVPHPQQYRECYSSPGQRTQSYRCQDTVGDRCVGSTEAAHPPYSPDLPPLDFSYFPQLKSHLRGNRFQDREELMYAIQEFNRSLDSGWVSDMFQSG